MATGTLHVDMRWGSISPFLGPKRAIEPLKPIGLRKRMPRVALRDLESEPLSRTRQQRPLKRHVDIHDGCDRSIHAQTRPVLGLELSGSQLPRVLRNQGFIRSNWFLLNWNHWDSQRHRGHCLDALGRYIYIYIPRKTPGQPLLAFSQRLFQTSDPQCPRVQSPSEALVGICQKGHVMLSLLGAGLLHPISTHLVSILPTSHPHHTQEKTPETKSTPPAPPALTPAVLGWSDPFLPSGGLHSAPHLRCDVAPLLGLPGPLRQLGTCGRSRT